MKFLLPLFIIFTIAIRPILPLMNYVVNYESIIKNECVNRGNPQQTCNGKCFIAKELVKTEKQSPQIFSKSNAIDTFVTTEILNFDPSFLKHFVGNAPFFAITNQHVSSYIADIFHPPLG